MQQTAARKCVDFGETFLESGAGVFNSVYDHTQQPRFHSRTLTNIFETFYACENEERVKMKCDPSSSGTSRIWALFLFFLHFKKIINYFKKSSSLFKTIEWGAGVLAFRLHITEKTPTYGMVAAALILWSFSVFSPSKRKKKEKAFKESMTSEAFGGSL